MAAAQYAYTGGTEMWYQQYRDTDTGRMLITEPGGSYSMEPTDPGLGLSVPPGDGRWLETPAPVAPAPPAPAPVPAPAPAPAPAPEGGVQ